MVEIASGSIDLKSLKVAGDGAAKYITEINSAGIFISPSNQSPTSSATGNSVQIDGTGMTVYKDGISVAMYGDTARIGKESSKHAMIDDEGFSMWASDSLIAQLAYGYTMTDSGTAYIRPYYVLGQQDTAISYTVLRKTGASQPGIIVIYDGAYYISTSAIAQNENWTPSHWKLLHGAYSLTEGQRCIATGSAAHAEGMGTTADGTGSHAEGEYSIASGIYSHAEGQYSVASGNFAHAEGGSAISNRGTTASGHASHAEGDQTTASSWAAHAEGSYTIAKHQNTHAQNYCTIAAKWCQTALGKFNIEDTNTVVDPVSSYDRGTYAVIVGNGTAEDARSNALTVDWNGGVELKNGLTQIYNAEYNSLNNTYYKTDGYHAFYATDTAGVASTGSFYIYGDHLMSSVPLNMRVSGTDYPVQGFTTGTSGNWRYRKWSGGKVEAWYSGSVSAGSTTAQTNVYRSAYSISIPSGIFSSTPIINISFNQTATTVFGVNGKASSSTAISGNIFRANASSSSYDVDLSIYAWTN